MNDDEIDAHGKEILHYWNYELPIKSKESIALIKTVMHFEKQARADERYKTLHAIVGGSENCHILYEAERKAYAKGMSEACSDCTDLKDGYKNAISVCELKWASKCADAFRRGQDELIARVEKEFVTCWFWGQLTLDQQQAIYGAIKKASDVVASADATSRPSSEEDVRSLGAKGDESAKQVIQDLDKSKQAPPKPANPEEGKPSSVRPAPTGAERPKPETPAYETHWGKVELNKKPKKHRRRMCVASGNASPPKVANGGYKGRL